MSTNKILITIMFFLISQVVILPIVYAKDSRTLKPIEVVKEATEKILDIARQKNITMVNKYALVSQSMSNYVDVEFISRFVLGKYWRTSSDKQKRQFDKEFRRLMVYKYLEMFSEHTDAYIEYTENPQKSKVHMVIYEMTEYNNIGISYKLHKKSGKWRIYSIVVEGVNLLANYRSLFNYEIKRNGIDSLIKHLMKRNTVN
jgi:phospholipid transport system substrate-binding protein